MQAARQDVARALVVLPDRWLRLQIAADLEALGYSTTTTSNGFGALRLLARDRPRVLVLQSDLPELSAELLLREVPALGLPSMLTIVVLGNCHTAEPWPTGVRVQVDSAVSVQDVARVVRQLVPATDP